MPTTGPEPSSTRRAPRVAIIGTRGYPSFYGGFETAVRRIAPALTDAGWSVTVYGRRGATSGEASLADSRVARVDTPGIDSRSLSTLSYGLTSTLHAMVTRPDVALVMNVANGYWLPLLRLRGIPVVVNVDGIEWERAKWSRAAKAVFRGGARLTAGFASTIVGDARAIVERWRVERGVDAIFIPYGGDDVESLPLDEALTSRTFALFVARFVPENSVSEFFVAAERIAETHDVVIVGSTGSGGALDEEASSLDRRLDRVRWLGHLDDHTRLLTLWQHCGAYFHGHTVGGTNPALVQAMFCGAPVVARSTVYNREVLGAEAGFVGGRPDDIAAAVLDLLDDPDEQARRSLHAQSRAREHYTWAEVCDAYEAVLTAAVARRARS